MTGPAELTRRVQRREALSELGAVVRCRGCDGVLMVLVQVRGITCVDLQGVASLTPA